MLNKEQVNECLMKLTDSVVQLDDDNTCILGVNNDSAMHLMFNPSLGTVDVISDIGDLSEEESEVRLAIITELMTANFMWNQTVGRTLALLDDRTTVVCQDRYVDTEDKSLDTFLNDFADFIEYMKERFIDLQKSSKEEYERSLNDDIPDIDYEEDDDVYEDLSFNTNMNMQVFNV